MSNRCMKCMREIKEGYHFCPICGYDNQAGRNPERALPVGTILENKYQIGAVLGEGGFGITYVAWDMLIGIKIAIKEYFPSELVTRDTTLHDDSSAMNLTLLQGNDTDTRYRRELERFVLEAENLAKFQKYPGIVSVKDFFYANNTAYMVMEYIDGMTLSAYLLSRGNKISADETLRMLEPVMLTLDQVHQAGIIHRDISPDNIMITTTGQMKLIDFGASRFVGMEGDKSLTVILRHGYAPEEQYRSNGLQGPWTDVYALCAVMYRMLTGEVPVETVQRMMGGADTVHKTLAQLPELSKQMRSVLEKGLAVKAEKRFRTIGSLHEKLYHPSSKNRFPWMLAGIVGVAAILVCAEAVFLRSRVNPDIIPSEQVTIVDDKDKQLTQETLREEMPQEEVAETAPAEPDIPEEPDHIRALREYYNENCVGETGRVYFADLTEDDLEEMIVVKDVQTVDPDDSYGRTISTPNVSVYQYADDDIHTIYSYQPKLHESWDSEILDLYLTIQNTQASILLYYREMDVMPHIEKTAFVTTDQNHPSGTELSQDDLQKQIQSGILLTTDFKDADNIGIPSWNILEPMIYYADVLACKSELIEIKQIAETAGEPILDYACIYENDTKCIFATTGTLDDTSGMYTLSVWASHNSQTEKITTISVNDEGDHLIEGAYFMSWDKCDLYQFGKSYHYFLSFSAPRFQLQHKFCFENGIAREVEGEIYFIKNSDGRIQANFVSNLNFSCNGNSEGSFLNYDYVDIFYYDQQYVEYGTVLVENAILEKYDNHEEILQAVEVEIYKQNQIPFWDGRSISFEINTAQLDHIRKSDNNIYYLNYKISGHSSDYNEDYEGWLYATVEPSGNQLELKKDLYGNIITFGYKHEHSDLGLPVYMNGEIVQNASDAGS